MKINRLSLTNYRNYKKESVDLSSSINIFIGNNAAGKTNILESIYTLALARSYKAKDKDMIKTGEPFYKIDAEVAYFNRDENLTIIATPEGKKILADNVEIRKLSDFIGRLNVVMFSPDDILMLKNGPQEKRKLIDMSLLQISKSYIDEYSQFKKQLKFRNDYLKYAFPKLIDAEEINDDMLNIATMNFIECNKKIYEKRLKFISDLEKVTQEKYRELSGEDAEIKLEYLINFENDIEFYKKRYKQDLALGTTQCGCQRDDIRFLKNGCDFETNCSQGEQRMLSLSLKLALADILKKLKREAPVVLLDDVFSELDKNHQNRLLIMLDRTMQIIITTTDILKIGDLALKNSKVFMINHAMIKETQAHE